MTTSTVSPSASVFFNEPAELAYLNSCEFLHEALFFPERKVIDKVVKETIFNTRTLQFEPVNEGEECGLYCGDTEPNNLLKYIAPCRCREFICKSCLLRCIASNSNYRRCPFGRCENFCPTITNGTINTVVGSTLAPITHRQITRYRNELLALENIKLNAEYYKKYITDQNVLTPYQCFLREIALILASDLFNDDYDDDEVSELFYISKGGLNEFEIEPFDTPNTPKDIIGSDINIIFRDDDHTCYTEYLISVKTDDDFFGAVLERLLESPLEFPTYFLFDRCLKTEFKEAFDTAENDIFQLIISDGNDAMMTAMFRNEDILYDNIKLYLHQYIEDFRDILNYHFIGETRLNTSTTQDPNNEYIWLCVCKNDLLEQIC